MFRDLHYTNSVKLHKLLDTDEDINSSKRDCLIELKVVPWADYSEKVQV